MEGKTWHIVLAKGRTNAGQWLGFESPLPPEGQHGFTYKYLWRVNFIKKITKQRGMKS